MKIKPEHLARLKEHVEAFNSPHNRALYAKRDPSILNITKTNNLDMRFRWDCLWSDRRVLHGTNLQCDVSPERIQKRVALVDEMYEYMNDDHIDTALRSLIKPLGATNG